MLSPDKYSAEHIEPIRLSDERHDTLMRELCETVLFQGVGKQVFSGVYVNRDYAAQPLNIRLGSFFSSSRTAEQIYANYQYAAAMPERPLVYLDMPGHALSGKLTLKQWYEIYTSRTLKRLSASQAEAIYNFSPSDIGLVTGDSLGARMTPNVASALGNIGLAPDVMMGFDMAGIDKRPSLTMAKAFFIAEQKRQRMYHKGTANQELDRRFEVTFKSDMDEAGVQPRMHNPIEVYRRNALQVSFIAARSPIAADTGFEAIQEALESMPNLQAYFVSGEKSNISRKEKIERTVNAFYYFYGDRFNWSYWPNDSHSMSIAPQQPRFAAYTRDTLLYLSDAKEI